MRAPGSEAIFKLHQVLPHSQRSQPRSTCRRIRGMRSSDLCSESTASHPDGHGGTATLHSIPVDSNSPSPPRMHAGMHLRVQRVISSVFGPRSSCPKLGPRMSACSVTSDIHFTGCIAEKSSTCQCSVWQLVCHAGPPYARLHLGSLAECTVCDLRDMHGAHLSNAGPRGCCQASSHQRRGPPQRLAGLAATPACITTAEPDQ
jgi:hypothetical protein